MWFEELCKMNSHALFIISTKHRRKKVLQIEVHIGYTYFLNAFFAKLLSLASLALVFVQY
jgi:hypothetical protein